jgi:hypothetical protein
MSIYTLFLDDTYRESDGFVGLGGYITEIKDFCSLIRKYYKIKDKYNIPLETEIKWSPPPDNWIHDNLVKKARKDAYTDFLEIIQDINNKPSILLSFYDINNCELTKEKAVKNCLKFITERFQMFLQQHNKKEDNYGLIIIDNPSGGNTNIRNISKFFSRLIAGELTNEDKVIVGNYETQFKNILSYLTIKSSKNYEPLQIADIIVGSSLAHFTLSPEFSTPFVPIILENIHEDKDGLKINRGIKAWPNEFAESVNKFIKPFEKQQNKLISKQPINEDDIPF